MKKHQAILLVFLFFLSKVSLSQDLVSLKTYLEKNHTSLDLRDIHTPNELIRNSMEGKNLFVFGEYHQLKFNDSLRAYLCYRLAEHNLKYFFIESGRSSAYIRNQYLQGKEGDSIFSYSPLYNSLMKELRNLVQKGKKFEFRGIDNERPNLFYYAIKGLTANLSSKEIQNNDLLRAILVDTNYLNLKTNNWVKQQGIFLKKYKNWQTIFQKDSSTIQKLVSPNAYIQIKYFLENPQTKNDGANRNPKMAENLVTEIMPFDTTASYLLNVGMNHSTPKYKGQMVGILNRIDVLKNRIVVMNTFCDACTPDKSIKFFGEKKILEIFRSVATSDLTIFDLSELPPAFAYMKEYGDLIVFAKNKN